MKRKAKLNDYENVLDFVLVKKNECVAVCECVCVSDICV